MRIFSGTARGRFLNGPKGVDLRPTTDRTRLALFNVIGALVPGSRFLDLCCGSGSVGLEALSRGADKVYFVDSHKLCIDAVRTSAQDFGFDAGRYELIKGDYQRGLNALASRDICLDLAFVDPPYEAGLGAHALRLLLELNLLRPGAKAILEHAVTDESPQQPGLALYKRYDHGGAALSVYSLEEAQLAG